MTTPTATPLHQCMKPWKLRVDWLCQEAYGDKVIVELHVMDDEPVTLRRFDSAPEAAGWARQFIEDRGFSFSCDIDLAQREGWTHITLFPRPKED